MRLLEKESYGAALLYFTGSKEHNVALRGRANKMGYTLNEYALATLKGERPVAARTEEEIYAKLKLDFIPPELRENTGEIEAAAEHRLPHLIELADMRGDLQMHTTASDGKNSIEEMALAAKALGYEYIALTDHSKAVTVANGLDEKRTLEQIKKIHAANAKNLGIRILASSEVDVLKNGKLDLDDEVLAATRRGPRLDPLLHESGARGNDRAHARGHRKSLHANHRASHRPPAAAPRRLCVRHGAHSGRRAQTRRRHGVQRFARSGWT